MAANWLENGTLLDDDKKQLDSSPDDGSNITTSTADEDDIDSILPRRQCSAEWLIDVSWLQTEAGVLALRPCPEKYTGSVYRACYSSGMWGSPDYSECRLDHLREVKNLVRIEIGG